MAALCFSGMSATSQESELQRNALLPSDGGKPPSECGRLTIKGVDYDPASITWSPVAPATTITGAVQIAAAFTVTRADGTVIAGEADDYVLMDAAGELIPIPKRIALLLVRASVVTNSSHEVKP